MTKQTIRVVRAKYVSGYQLRIRFSDGVEKVVDFSRWLHGEVFRPLADQREFKRFFSLVEPSAGRTAPISRPRLFDQSKKLQRTRADSVVAILREMPVRAEPYRFTRFWNATSDYKFARC